MTLDEILNGNLEQEIRREMQRLEDHASKNSRPVISISIRGFGSDEGFVAADLDGIELGCAGFGKKSLADAVTSIINAMRNPTLTEKRRQSISNQIATLQSELERLQSPEAQPTTSEVA